MTARTNWHSFPERLVPRAARRMVHPKRGFQDILSLFVDILELGDWHRMDLLGFFLAAAFVAALVEPLAHGSLGNSIVALMTPVK
jgi:hypothetical protein